MGCEDCEGVGWGTGRDAAGRDASFDGPPPGPPGRSNLPCVMGLPALGLPFGVGLETEFAGSPGPV